jgi:hypothetical protein
MNQPTFHMYSAGFMVNQNRHEKAGQKIIRVLNETKYKKTAHTYGCCLTAEQTMLSLYFNSYLKRMEKKYYVLFYFDNAFSNSS